MQVFEELNQSVEINDGIAKDISQEFEIYIFYDHTLLPLWQMYHLYILYLKLYLWFFKLCLKDFFHWVIKCSFVRLF